MATLLNVDLWLAPRFGWTRGEYEKARRLHCTPDPMPPKVSTMVDTPAPTSTIVDTTAPAPIVTTVTLLLAAIGPKVAWQRDAACLEHPELSWFDVRDEAAAKAVCASCLVRQECMADAVAGREAGLWGGTDERDRSA